VSLARSLAIAAILGLALRLLFALGYWTGQPLTRDEREYLALARGLATGRGFVSDADVLDGQPDPFGRAPGYPVFLALVGGGRGPTASVPAAVKIAQSVAGAFGVVLIGLVAARLAGATAGRAAALIAAGYPPLVWIAAYAYSEALIWPVGVALVWLFDRATLARRRPDGRPDPTAVGAATGGGLGLLTGVAILIRPAMAIFLGLAILWCLRRRAVTLALALGLGAAAIVTPWTIRTSHREGRLVLVASEGGVTFWTGNHPLAIGEGDFAANPDLKRESLALRARHPELNERQMEPVYYGEAFAWIRAHPWRWLVLEIRKIFYLVVPVGPSYRLHSMRYYVASVVSYVGVLTAALVGFWWLGERRRAAPGLWLLGASAVLVALVFFPQERFRIPSIDPVLIVCAGACAMRPSPEAART
jgi:4-amino-4-deoxy-L-arabinose transferase-like glycosyltransferase